MSIIVSPNGNSRVIEKLLSSAKVARIDEAGGLAVHDKDIFDGNKAGCAKLLGGSAVRFVAGGDGYTKVANCIYEDATGQHVHVYGHATSTQPRNTPPLARR